MSELERHTQSAGGTSIDGVLSAIEFQTALLTLNAAVEAAHRGRPPSPPSSAPNPAEQAAPKDAANRRQSKPASRQAGGSQSAPRGSHLLPCCEPSANGPAATDRWQRSLERLQTALAAACGADLPHGANGRSHPQPPQPTPAPEPIPVLRPKRRSTPWPPTPPPRFQDHTE